MPDKETKAIAAELLDSVQDNGIDAMVEMLAGIHRAKQMRDEAAERSARRDRGCDGEREPARVTLGGDENPSDLWFDVARFQMKLVKDVLEFHRKHRDILLERIGRSLAPATASEVGLLRLEGKLGDRAQGLFVVENRSSKKARIALALSELHTRSGGDPFRAPDVSFTPASPFDLEPDQERKIGIVVTLAKPPFEAGHRYRGEIQISTPGRDKRRIPVRVDVAPGPVLPVGPAGESAK